jgi:succinate dehydrogenase / fumarate reductase flavoprotein subunit
MTNSHRTHISNVLVIGSGAAGLRAAIAAHLAGCAVVVVGKRSRCDAHTVLAAGGINAALGTVDPEDTWRQHFADTFEEAYYLSNPRMVEIMVRESPAEVLQLADWGARFARLPDGRLDQRFFGAHTYRRTCYAGDYTGRELIQTLDRKAAELGITVIENQYISRLLVADEVCFGAFGFDIMTGARTVFLADAVVLAAGGHTRLWRRSSSRRDENTGDGIYLGLQAGAELMDMELVQFHPSGMVTPEDWAGTLVTEAVRGEGGILRNKDGERFMQRYDPERLELSTRDRVAMAVYTEIIEGRGTPNGGVYLDISHRSKEYILEKLPRMYRQFLEAQMLDISRQPMEVAPTAHYSMGGVVVDPDTAATAVQGLYAAGEVTAGLHGANRLGGNSLAETLVFGRRAGEHAAARSLSLTYTRRNPSAIKAAHAELDALIHPGTQLARPLQRALRDTMWESGGVVRTEERLARGLERIDELKQQARDVDVRPSSEGYKDLAIALDLRAALVVAEATLLGAQERRESRGAHARSDYLALDPALTGNFFLRQDGNGRLSRAFRPAPPVPEALHPFLEKRVELAQAGRLLE